MPPKRKIEKYILIAMHLGNTAGLSMGFAMKKSLMIVGNTVLVILLLTICVWMWPTYQKIQRYATVGHPNAAPARAMFWAGVAAMPLWMVRVVYGLVFAITQDPALDSILGSFTVKFVILFWMYVGAMIPILLGGWLSIGWQKEVGTTVEYLGDQDETAWDRERRRTMRRERRRIMYGTDDAPLDRTVMSRETPTITEVVRPKSSHASSMTMYTTRNSLHAASSSLPLRPKSSQASSGVWDGTLHPASSSRPLRPKPSQASSQFGEGSSRPSISSRPLRQKPSQASSTLVESNISSAHPLRSPRWPLDVDFTRPGEGAAVTRWPSDREEIEQLYRRFKLTK